MILSDIDTTKAAEKLTSLLRNHQKKKRFRNFGIIFSKMKKFVMTKQNGCNNLKKLTVETQQRLVITSIEKCWIK